MHRLFVALRPPPAMQGELLALMGGVPGARWQTGEQLHLTLRFIGEVDRRAAEDIAMALGSIGHPRPRVALDGVGAFDRKAVVHTLWAGVAADEMLMRLRDRIERALARVGIPPDPRAFRPHITLARCGRATGPLDGFLAAHLGLRGAPVTLDAFLLFESSLGGAGATYTVVERYPLR